MLTTLRILIVDDERLALDRLRRVCSRIDGVEVVGLAASGAEALHQVETCTPDVVLLDVTMPGLDGIETGRLLRTRANPPAIIFTTAHEQFAIDAFSLAATHYLLKPVLHNQLAEALGRVRMQQTPSPDDMAMTLEEIWVSHGYELFRLDLATVELIEAEGDYMRFHADGRSYLHYVTIKQLASVLNNDWFIRVHRSFIVAKRCVRTLRPRGQGRWALILDSGRNIPISASYLHAVRKLANRLGSAKEPN